LLGQGLVALMPELRDDALRRADAALATKRQPQPLDIAAARAELNELLAFAKDVIA